MKLDPTVNPKQGDVDDDAIAKVNRLSLAPVLPTSLLACRSKLSLGSACLSSRSGLEKAREKPRLGRASARMVWTLRRGNTSCRVKR